MPDSPPRSPQPYDYEDFPYVDRSAAVRSPYPNRTQSIVDLRRSEAYNFPRRSSVAELGYRRVCPLFYYLYFFFDHFVYLRQQKCLFNHFCTTLLYDNNVCTFLICRMKGFNEIKVTCSSMREILCQIMVAMIQ